MGIFAPNRFPSVTCLRRDHSGLCLVACIWPTSWCGSSSLHSPCHPPSVPKTWPWRRCWAPAPPLLLIVAVLGSILGGYAPQRSPGGAFGAVAGSLLHASTNSIVDAVMTVHHRHGVSFCCVIFPWVFRGYGGDEMVQALFAQMPGGMWGWVS